MSSFADSKGRKHVLSVTIGSVRSLKEAMGVDLLDIGDGGKALIGIAADPFLLAEVLYRLSGTDVPEEDFAAALDGQAIEQGVDALMEAVVHFFQHTRPQVGTMLAELLQRVKESQGDANEAVAKVLSAEKVGPLVKQELAKASEQMERALATYGEKSSSSPASLESTPAD